MNKSAIRWKGSAGKLPDNGSRIVRKQKECRFQIEVSTSKSISRNASSGKKETPKKRLAITQTERYRRFTGCRLRPVGKRKGSTLPETGTRSELVHFRQTPGKGKIRSTGGWNPATTKWQHFRRAGVETAANQSEVRLRTS
jgi:hypothetical protein